MKNHEELGKTLALEFTMTLEFTLLEHKGFYFIYFSSLYLVTFIVYILLIF